MKVEKKILSCDIKHTLNLKRLLRKLDVDWMEADLTVSLWSFKKQKYIYKKEAWFKWTVSSQL